MRSVDERLHRHSITVSLWTLALARALGFPEGSLHDMALAGLLHDVGLLELPRELVFGRGPRSDAERALLRRHPRLGAVRLCRVPDVGAVPIVVAHEHHLRFDGQEGGYPALGRRPHLAARLVAVVDTWDMFRSATAGYAPRQRHAWVLQALRSRAGTWLDPELVERFVELLGEAEAATIGS
jgi:HD-GYP domain-containing protein (c-di-GMP phosphodiesterase class II)